MSNSIEAMAESGGAEPRVVGDELKALLTGLERVVTPAEMLKALSEDASE